jgi:predicted DNA-binding WGR domain protein
MRFWNVRRLGTQVLQTNKSEAPAPWEDGGSMGSSSFASIGATGCFLFRAWGRVGDARIGGNKIEQLPLAEAIEQFEELFYEKSGNNFRRCVVFAGVSRGNRGNDRCTLRGG